MADLDRAGLRVIQIDEPALREGLPLRRGAWGDYLRVGGRLLPHGGVGGGTGHTDPHAHVLQPRSTTSSPPSLRSTPTCCRLRTRARAASCCACSRDTGYQQEIGPGVYDIHSPRVPSEDEIVAMLQATLAVLPAERVWVNPDCGLKTRTWDEATPALRTWWPRRAAFVTISRRRSEAGVEHDVAGDADLMGRTRRSKKFVTCWTSCKSMKGSGFTVAP